MNIITGKVEKNKVKKEFNSFARSTFRQLLEHFNVTKSEKRNIRFPENIF